MKNKQSLRLALSVGFLCVSICSKTFSNDFIDSYFRDYNHPDTPGASVLVMKKGEVLYERGYGAAKLSELESATEHTNFRLASLSKQFTATAILLLVQRGLLSLDTKLVSIFPEFPDYGSKITVRHLLNHTSGLKDYENLIPSSQTEQISDQDVLALLKKQSSLYFTPGSQYQYSNGGYVLLGLIVEAVSRQNFSEFLRDNVFIPLEMSNTVMFESGVTDISNRAFGYSPKGNGFKLTDQDITSATRGDGGIYTSAHEWIKWETAINNNLILSKEFQDLAFTPGKLNNGSLTKYGCGWMLDSFQGLTHQFHTGSSIGFRTGVERFPEKGLTVLVLVNRSNSSPWTIARNIAERFFE